MPFVPAANVDDVLQGLTTRLEVWADGTSRCGNGHTIPVVAYVPMKAG